MAVNENLVSIIIPTYNQAGFLKEALDCVLKQSWRDWEAVVINNFSTDDTKNVVSSFQDSRVRCIDFKNQGVIAASRNLGIKEAKGAFIAFLDSDDTWEPGKLEACMLKLKEGFDLVCHGEYHFVDGLSDRRPVRYGPIERTRYSDLLSRGNCLSTSAIVLRRQILENTGSFATEPELNTAEDFDLWLRISASGARIAVIDEMLGSYRIHPASASASGVKNAKATLAVILKHLKSVQGNLNGIQKLRAFAYALRIRLYILRKG